MARALELESQRWTQDVDPQRLDGHCHSELAIDIIQVAQPPPHAHGQPVCEPAMHVAESIPVYTHMPTSEPAPFQHAPHPCPAVVYMGPCSACLLPLQIISQGQAKAESITLDLGMQIKHMLLMGLAAFLRRWVCVLAALRGPTADFLEPQVGIQDRSAPLPAPRVSVPTGR